jgi:hypothetical protein
VHRKGAARLAGYFNLPAGNRAIAQDADPSVVERIPFAMRIARLKDRELVFRKKRSFHV